MMALGRARRTREGSTSRTGRARALRLVVIGALLAISILGRGLAATAQTALVVEPGETLSGLSASGGVTDTGHCLLTDTCIAEIQLPQSAFRLFLIPRPVAITTDPHPSSAVTIWTDFTVAEGSDGAETLLAGSRYSIDIDRVGRIVSLNQFDEVSIIIRLSIRDTTSGFAAVDPIAVEEATITGDSVSYRGVPLPVPGQLTLNTTSTFEGSLDLRRGHTYRIELAARVTAKKPLPGVIVGSAQANFRELIVGVGDGGIGWSNLSILAGDDPTQQTTTTSSPRTTSTTTVATTSSTTTPLSTTSAVPSSTTLAESPDGTAATTTDSTAPTPADADVVDDSTLVAAAADSPGSNGLVITLLIAIVVLLASLLGFSIIRWRRSGG